MVDTISQAHRSRVMAQVRSKNTRPEIKVRQAIHAAGFRFQLHSKKLPGKPDIVLPRYRTVVLVNGCFWHWHGCAACRMPSTRTDYWIPKIKRNRERDKANRSALEANGWTVETVWECELEAGIQTVIYRLEVLRAISAGLIQSFPESLVRDISTRPKSDRNLSATAKSMIVSKLTTGQGG